MTTVFLVLLVVIDLVLLGIVFVLAKRQVNPVEILRDLAEERRLLKDLRETIQDEMNDSYSKVKSMADRVSTVAAEVDMEMKSGRDTFAKIIEEAVQEFSQRIEKLAVQITKRQVALEKLSKAAGRERDLLTRALERGEKLSHFFRNQMPYEQVLEEIEDKKYLDARELLVKGITPHEVARTLNLPEAEVTLIASVL